MVEVSAQREGFDSLPLRMCRAIAGGGICVELRRKLFFFQLQSVALPEILVSAGWWGRQPHVSLAVVGCTPATRSPSHSSEGACMER